MATTMYVPQLVNTASEVTAEGQIAKNGMRFSPADGDRQAVLNLNLKFQRRWKDKTTDAWTGKESFVGYALWGDRAVALHTKLAALDPSLKDIRIKVTFSMADVEARIWGTEKDKTEVNIRASVMDLTGAYPFLHERGETTEAPASPVDDGADIPL